ncbi:MAG TPA: type IX secretion system sortase PorU [Bacteroidia bacterium]|nr:type IX secretion system sortase PorU [Bacteroidia bacterium]
MSIFRQKQSLPPLNYVFICLLFSILQIPLKGFSQKNKYSIVWQTIQTDESGKARFSFKDASYPTDFNGLPEYSILIEGHKSAALSDQKYLACTSEENNILNSADLSSFPQEINAVAGISRKEKYTTIHIFPFRRSINGQFEKLTEFSLDLRDIPNAFSSAKTNAHVYAANSVLSTGKWMKIAVTDDGVYKVDYDFLTRNGFSSSELSLTGLQLFGNGGGMLPLQNSISRADDLTENAIEMVDADQSGTFNAGDYFLFYGEGPNRWAYNNIEKKYQHSKNYFSDSTFYFITANSSVTGKRITSTNANNSTTADRFASSFTDYAFHEEDDYNFIKSGRNWYGNPFDVTLSQNFDFSFPNLITGTAKIKSSVIARTSTKTSTNSKFNIFYNGTNILSHTISNVGTGYTDDFARASILPGTFNASGNDINLNYVFVPYNSSSTGWIDYIELNVTRALNFQGINLAFRDQDTINTASITRYSITSGSSGEKIWNVTDPTNAFEQKFDKSGNIATFTSSLAASGSSEYYMFSNAAIKSPQYSGKIVNQDLHSLAATDMIIVTHPDFLQESERLAQFRRDHDNLRVTVATTDQIFNEFSSGAQDAAAIRDFVKMFYDRANGTNDQPRYLLLMGDGSYDPKTRIGGNTNYITTFQSDNSISLINSYTSDDFYGMLDDNEGSLSSSDLMDIGVGRIPVRDATDARLMVDKIITYETPGTITDQTFCAGTNSTRFGDWRNTLCFVADDQDSNLHFRQSERIANTIQANQPVYNIDKIVSDAYKQQSTPGGQRYPDVNDAIDKRIEKGAFLMNYTGHGGELGWAAEAILNINMINGWNNINSLPAFITATCEFSRYDDPKRTSAGELVLLNSNGGGICLFTTVRLAFAIDNEYINADMLRYMFAPINGEMPRIGDIQRLAKRENAGNRNVTLLGDPSIRLAYPQYKVNTTSIQETGTGVTVDTLSSLSKITITGNVSDAGGNVLNNFNGVVYTTIFDKTTKVYNLVNDVNGDDVSKPDSFLLRKNILYKGKSSVTNGQFSCSFIVPKDISYQYGTGRLSYYAHTTETDAQGYNEQIQIGGISNNSIQDQYGPKINLYINDENFTAGGMTDENPSILAILFDSSGINTVGNGIGHDITAIIDNKQQALFVLNDYYESDLDSYQKGRVRYKLSDLADGNHTLTFKAWDINGNSSDVSTDFVVTSSAELAIDHVLNYPNPFSTKTAFYFEHNKPCTGMTVQVQVFTVSGKLVKTLSNYQVCEGYRNSPLEWDGKDDFGDQLAKGVYIYRLKIRTADGETAEKLERLVLLR